MISVLQLGTQDYATALKLQQRLVALRKDNQIGDVLLLLEHPPVITLGRNAQTANILASPEFLIERGVEVVECDRGGDVTFHGPGQLVGYPIFDLRAFTTPSGERKTLGAIEFVRKMEEALIRTCADFRIPATRIPKLTGVWTSPATADIEAAKIAAIGIHISRAVTSHGFALNVNTDLKFLRSDHSLRPDCQAGHVNRARNGCALQPRPGCRIHLAQLRPRLPPPDALARLARCVARQYRGCSRPASGQPPKAAGRRRNVLGVSTPNPAATPFC